MLHIVAFAFFSITLMVVASGLAFMLHASREKIMAALQSGFPEPVPIAVEFSRVRVIRTVRDRRFMPPLRAAA